MILDAIAEPPILPRTADLVFMAHSEVKQVEEQLLNESISIQTANTPDIVPFQNLTLIYQLQGGSNMLSIRTDCWPLFVPMSYSAMSKLRTSVALAQLKGGRPGHMRVITHSPADYTTFLQDEQTGSISMLSAIREAGYLVERGRLDLYAPGEEMSAGGETPSLVVYQQAPGKREVHPELIATVTEGTRLDSIISDWFSTLLEKHGLESNALYRT
jgi:hypothetical protein